MGGCFTHVFGIIVVSPVTFLCAPHEEVHRYLVLDVGDMTSGLQSYSITTLFCSLGITMIVLYFVFCIYVFPSSECIFTDHWLLFIFFPRLNTYTMLDSLPSCVKNSVCNIFFFVYCIILCDFSNSCSLKKNLLRYFGGLRLF